MITGTVGQVASSTWDFGDGSPAVQETNPTHVFEKSGNYTVKISAIYADGTIRNAEIDFVVTDE
jgi:PKD repeat protein